MARRAARPSRPVKAENGTSPIYLHPFSGFVGVARFTAVPLCRLVVHWYIYQLHKSAAPGGIRTKRHRDVYGVKKCVHTYRYSYKHRPATI